jgi:5-methylcytosine-specific restriction endonuclease McrA
MQLTFAFAGSPPKAANDNFYLSDQWIRLRYRTLSKRGNVCECCGHTWKVNNPLQVDHIKPRSRYPHLALAPSNLQILCRDCNMGKSNTDESDWRRRLHSAGG